MILFQFHQRRPDCQVSLAAPSLGVALWVVTAVTRGLSRILRQFGGDAGGDFRAHASIYGGGLTG